MQDITKNMESILKTVTEYTFNNNINNINNWKEQNTLILEELNKLHDKYITEIEKSIKIEELNAIEKHYVTSEGRLMQKVTGYEYGKDVPKKLNYEWREIKSLITTQFTKDLDFKIYQRKNILNPPISYPTTANGDNHGGKRRTKHNNKKKNKSRKNRRKSKYRS